MKKDLLIGIDCSTTASKAIVWDKRGTYIAEKRQKIPLISPYPEWAEQPAECWWDSTADALKSVVREIDRSRIAAIGITHQRETFVPLDGDMKPLRNGITWVDTRSKTEVEMMKKTCGDKINNISGRYPNLYASNSKIMWLREHEPSLFKRTYKYVDVGGYLLYRFTGNGVTSFPSACPMGIVDIKEHRWSEEIMLLLGVQREQFFDLVSPGTVAGGLTAEAAAAVGLPEGIPVVAGGGDGQCASIGAGVVGEGRASLNLGTAVVSQLCSNKYKPGKAYRSMCGCMPDTYINETLIAGGTLTVSWFIDAFGQDIKHLSDMSSITAEQVLEVMASAVKPGDPRLLLVPYWKGAAAPSWDQFAKGIVIGWSENMSRAHLYRAVLEGITFEQRYLYEETKRVSGCELEDIVLLGGGAKSPLWRRIVADICGIPVHIPHTFEATCLGAAMLAAYAVGLYKNVADAAEHMSMIRETYSPDMQNRNFYMKIYEKVYKRLFPKIRELVDEFTKLTTS
ncbi:MAG: FGGY-family carbohydrate kinase [Spirochaetes bacterium]|nr:FGGY-family carbohydrate kinase [Spirochaetota bacterium]